MNDWLLLMYKVPRQPTSGRVYVWRKLKQLGAALLQDSVWVLPSNPRTQEHFQWLVDEIRELGGEATMWTAQVLMGDQGKMLIRQFQERAEVSYRDILESLKNKKADLSDLSRRYQQVQAQDYFSTELSRRTQDALLAAQRRSKA